MLMPKGLWDAVGKHGPVDRHGPLFPPSVPWRYYEPMREAESILTDVLRLKREPGRSIPVENVSNFASTYGMLGVGTSEDPQFPLDEVRLTQQCLQEVQGGARTLAALQRKEWKEVDKVHPIVKGVPETDKAAYYWSQWQHWLNMRLRGEIPGLGQGISLGLEVEGDAPRHWALRVRTLADALWAALLFRAVAPQPMVECRKCHELFVPSRAGQEFCPPVSGEARSRCSNAFNVARWRRNKDRQRGRESRRRSSPSSGTTRR
jgi:hypothetical protein